MNSKRYSLFCIKRILNQFLDFWNPLIELPNSVEQNCTFTITINNASYLVTEFIVWKSRTYAENIMIKELQFYNIYNNTLKQ